MGINSERPHHKVMPTTLPTPDEELYKQMVACNQESSKRIADLVVKLVSSVSRIPVMGRTPEVVQSTLLRNPMFQNALPDTVIYNTLELATSWVDRYADLFSFQHISPSGQTYGEIRDRFNLGGQSAAITTSVCPPSFSSSFGQPGKISSGAYGDFGAIGTQPPAPTSSRGTHSSSPFYPSSILANRILCASPDTLSDISEQTTNPTFHLPKPSQTWDDIRAEMDRVFELSSRLNGQSESEDDTPSEDQEISDSDDGVEMRRPILPWSRMDAYPL